MIVKRQIKEQDIRDFFKLEMNKLEKSLGIAMFSYIEMKISFDDNAMEILNLNGLIPREKYNVITLRQKLNKVLQEIDIEKLNKDSSFIFVNEYDKEIVFKYERQNDNIKIYMVKLTLFGKYSMVTFAYQMLFIATSFLGYFLLGNLA